MSLRSAFFLSSLALGTAAADDLVKASAGVYRTADAVCYVSSIFRPEQTNLISCRYKSNNETIVAYHKTPQWQLIVFEENGKKYGVVYPSDPKKVPLPKNWIPIPATDSRAQRAEERYHALAKTVVQGKNRLGSTHPESEKTRK